MKDFKIYITIASLLLIIYLVAEYNQPKPIVWTPTYSKEDKIPYGTYILYNRITDIFPGSKIRPFAEPVYNVVNDYQISNATYIIICPKINLNEYDIDKLTDFIKKGNDVLISSHFFSDTLKKKFHIETDANYNAQGQPDSVHFVNKYLGQNKKYPLSKDYNIYFSDMDTANTISLVQNKTKQSTLIKYKLGKGTLFLDTNPEMFTNYGMLTPYGPQYVANVLSYLKSSKTILWDEYYTKGREGDESIMRVFFRNPALKWAYYIAMVSSIFFALYEMKRRQRIIPIIEPLRNSTLDFVNVVGQVYYEQRNNQNIAEKKITSFLEHIRTQYFLKTNPLNLEFIQALSQKTGIEHPFVTGLIDYINYLNAQSKVTDKELIQLNKLIEQFYIKSR